jgi:CRISPR/Cas system-associated exonuclease Cas4 (RecB family)
MNYWRLRNDGRRLSISELRERWVHTYRKENTEAIWGAEELWNFWQVFEQNQKTPCAIDISSPVEIAGHLVTPRIDLVLHNSDEKNSIEVVDFRVNRNPRNEFDIANDIRLTIASYAFRKLYSRTESDVLEFFSKKGKSFAVTKTKTDFDNLEVVVDNVARSIQNNIYIPRSECGGCEYQKVCMKGGKYLNGK